MAYFPVVLLDQALHIVYTAVAHLNSVPVKIFVISVIPVEMLV